MLGSCTPAITLDRAAAESGIVVEVANSSAEPCATEARVAAAANRSRTSRLSRTCGGGTQALRRGASAGERPEQAPAPEERAGGRGVSSQISSSFHAIDSS